MLREALAQRELRQLIRVDSAGTHASQSGRPADPRAQQVCRELGVDLRKCRARQFREADFAKYDYIVALDSNHYRWLLNHCPEEAKGQVSLMSSWCADGDFVDIPDPYFGNIGGFQVVAKKILEAVEGMSDRLGEDGES